MASRIDTAAVGACIGHHPRFINGDACRFLQSLSGKGFTGTAGLIITSIEGLYLLSVATDSRVGWATASNERIFIKMFVNRMRRSGIILNYECLSEYGCPS